MKAPAGGHLSPRLRWLGAAETDEEKKPSPGRGWQGEALTGVGRCRVGLGTAPLPAPGGHLPPGEGWRAAGSRPTVFPVHPGLPRKRWLFPLIRQGLWPCHLPRRGRLPPGGEIGADALAFYPESGQICQGSPPHPSRAPPGPPSEGTEGFSLAHWSVHIILPFLPLRSRGDVGIAPGPECKNSPEALA